MLRSLVFITAILVGLSLAHAERIYPMTPIYQNSSNSKKFIGVQIPYDAIFAVGGNVKEAFMQLRRLGLYAYNPGIIMHMKVNGKTTNTGLVGTLEAYDRVSFESSICAGICMESSRGKILRLGEAVTYGLNMNWSLNQGGDGRQKSGLWVSDPLSTFLEYGHILVEGQTAMDVALNTAKYGNYRLKAENRDPKSVDWPKAFFPALEETRHKSRLLNLKNFQVPEILKSKDLNKMFMQVRQNIKTELQWRSVMEPINNEAPVWSNVQASSLAQNICDLIHEAHKGPKELAPKCSVFASLIPNAYAYPGGDIFVSAGLMGVLPNVDTLIFFLAHEYTHIMARHTTQRMDKKDHNAILLSTLSLLTNVAALGSSDSIAEIAKTMGLQKITLSSLQFGIEGSLAHHTRSQEAEADRLGMEMAMNLGADHFAILEGLRALEHYCDDTFKRQQSGFLNDFMTADHHELQQRIRILESHALAYMEKMKNQTNFAREFDSTYESIQQLVKPLSNYYRLNLKSLQ